MVLNSANSFRPTARMIMKEPYFSWIPNVVHAKKDKKGQPVLKRKRDNVDVKKLGKRSRK